MRWPARRFFCPWREHAGGGAFGRGPVRAAPATPVRGQVRREDVARRGQKPLGRSPGASFLSPLSLAIQRKGARGRRRRAAPEARRGLFCVWRYGRGKTYMNDSALLGRALGVGRATLGLPLQHHPCQERNSKSRQLIEVRFSATPDA